MINRFIVRYLRRQAKRHTMRSFKLLVEGSDADQALVNDLWSGAALLRSAAVILEWKGRGPLPRPDLEDG